MSNFFIIIVTYNSKKTIEKNIKSIDRKYHQNVVIVDNNSIDNTVELMGKYKDISIIKNKKNVGYGAGNNIGIRIALKKGARSILILNPDVVLHKGFIKNITKYLLGKQKFDIVGPKIYREDGKIWSTGGFLDKKRYTAGLIGYEEKDRSISNTPIRMVDFISGTAMLIKEDVFRKIGLFREDYFLYYEDVDFCIRAVKAGLNLNIDSELKTTHFESTSVGKNSSIMQYYLARNHLLFVERFALKYFLLREFIRLPKTVWQHYKNDEKFANVGIRDYFLRRFGKK